MVEWTTTERELVTGRGRYICARLGAGWEAQFRPRVPEGEDVRRVLICALNAEGELEDWRSREQAEFACSDHHERMVRFGESAEVAAAFIAANTDVFGDRHAA